MHFGNIWKLTELDSSENEGGGLSTPDPLKLVPGDSSVLADVGFVGDTRREILYVTNLGNCEALFSRRGIGGEEDNAVEVQYARLQFVAGRHDHVARHASHSISLHCSEVVSLELTRFRFFLNRFSSILFPMNFARSFVFALERKGKESAIDRVAS